MNRSLIRLRLCSMILSLMLLSSGCALQMKNNLTPDAVALHNQAMAQMGRFDFESAEAIYSLLTESFPEHPVLKTNHAISIINRQREGDEKLALDMLRQVLAGDPKSTAALYCCGLLELHMGNLAQAMSYFEKVLTIDPVDPEVLYFMAKTLMQMSRYDEALDYFNRAITLDPYMSSAYYGTIMTLRQLGRKNEAVEKIATYQKIKDNPRSHVVDFKYTKMGKKAEVQPLNSDVVKISTRAEGPLFNQPAGIKLSGSVSLPVAGRSDPGKQPAMTVCDINQDGFLDFFIPGRYKESKNLLLMGGEDPVVFHPETEHPLARVDGVNTALWGDMNDDGINDVYLCRNGTNQLWLQDQNHHWQEISIQSGTGNGDLNTVDGALFDADHDGDLDIFVVNSNGPNELFNNNRDGTFRPLAGEYGLKGSGVASMSVVTTDLDNDRDVDMIVINEHPPHDVYINELLWTFRKGDGFDRLINSDIRALVAGDIDGDGTPDLITMDGFETVSAWKADVEKKWVETPFEKTDTHSPGEKVYPKKMILSDVDGNGSLDLIQATAAGWQVFSFEMNRLRSLFDSRGNTGDTVMNITALSTPEGPAVIEEGAGILPRIWMPGKGRSPFLQLVLTGKKDAEANLRTNVSGIGTRVTVRNGSDWTVTDSFRKDSGPGQSLQPICIGLNGCLKVDFISLEWPDGVFQTEMGLEKDRLHRIAEIQRQMSSCPVMFAWNGEKYEFVSDILGVGGIGYAVGPGVYSEPRPWENFMFPPHLLAPQDGKFKIKIMEPMEEVKYLDSVYLTAYDLPGGWYMALDERMGISEPFPTGEPVFYQEFLIPVSAVNERKEDVTRYITKNDLDAAPVGKLDRRFIGRLEGEHVLTLDFDRPLDSFQAMPTLVMDGWVEYPYSQTSFAAWQARAEYQAPTIECMKPDGSWMTLLNQVGYPAGMPRQMSVPLPGLPKGVTTLRIRTNQEIYWDRIFLVFAKPCPGVNIRRMTLSAASLEYMGFPLRTDFDQRRPYYDFTRQERTWDSRIMAGDYTRFGDVRELLSAGDNAVAILGPGEGVHLEFDAPFDAVPGNCTRVVVLNSRGWCKDMDLYTHTGDTVAPVPFLGEVTEETRRLHEKYNIRYNSGKN